ncbi:hypothetical protein ABEB36_009007 [Hypothenemus hampei]|uniref:Integrin beta n=1 Tax=Hypothenemus hampei TaxID=57062 RepID=A0ABD1ERS1_HYPHA
MQYLTILIQFIFIVLESYAQEDCPNQLRLLCHEQTTCGGCIQAHVCCHWCYENSNTSLDFRCDFLDALKTCAPYVQFNKQSAMTIIEDLDFKEIADDQDVVSAVQIRPQKFNLVLRKNDPINITFTYKAAKNYPLELYFLGDLSHSMKPHLETLKNLGDSLSNSLNSLTRHYKLAFGSFLDKPGMPFIWTDSEKLENPCKTEDNAVCEQTYLFKHSLSFTNNTDEFFSHLNNSKVSANVDDMDGALEAIFQILVCNGQFGWSDYARKIILLSTDSLLHTEGDGFLVGAVKVNRKEICLVDQEGDHTDPLKYDYPSLGQIKSLLRKHKTNLIVAVTPNKKIAYDRMERDILEQEAFVGVLEENSKNILNLVRKGFYDFIRQVKFSANISHAPELDIKFFGNCENGDSFNETSGCQNVLEDQPINFIMQITLKENTDKREEIIFIREQNINENLEVNLEYVTGPCECQNYKAVNPMQCNEPNGKQDCHSCLCSPGWTGPTCSEECNDNIEMCRKDNERVCSGQGDCICGKCQCSNGVVGPFCEFTCPMLGNEICSGHGTCVEGVCFCEKGYVKDDCSCQDSTDKCRLTPESAICNGKGVCECNACQCEEGFSGSYCQTDKLYNTYCTYYDNYLRAYYEKDNFTVNDNLVLNETNDEFSKGSDVCSVIYYINRTRCTREYYYSKVDNKVQLIISNKEYCLVTIGAMSTVLGIAVFVLTILVGLILLLVRKYQIHRAELAEFKKFHADQIALKNSSSVKSNPIYRSPVSEFYNPMAK